MIHQTLSASLSDIAEPYHLAANVMWHSIVYDKPSLLRYLYATYSYVTASVPLMQLALTRLDCSVVTPYADYLAQHIEEERHHDEWLIEDLKELGGCYKLSHTECPQGSIQLAGVGYYTIIQWHPIALLGYIFALESAPPSIGDLRAIEDRCGVHANGLRTLYEHSSTDIEHRARLFEVIDAINADLAYAEMISATLVATLRAVLTMFEELRVACRLSQPL